MKLVVAIAEFIAAGLLITKAITGASWAQIIAGQAENVYKQDQADDGTTGDGSAIVATTNDIVTAKGGGKLNANQETFAKTLSKLSGLNLSVVEGWVAAEEPASAADAPNGANNWLNIGDTGSGNYAGSAAAWTNPTAAADETYEWIEGQDLPGYGAASSGIQNILSTAGGSVESQIAAIRASGWAKTGYPNLAAIVSEFV